MEEVTGAWRTEEEDEEECPGCENCLPEANSDEPDEAGDSQQESVSINDNEKIHEGVESCQQSCEVPHGSTVIMSPEQEKSPEATEAANSSQYLEPETIDLCSSDDDVEFVGVYREAPRFTPFIPNRQHSPSRSPFNPEGAETVEYFIRMTECFVVRRTRCPHFGSCPVHQNNDRNGTEENGNSNQCTIREINDDEPGTSGSSSKNN